MPKLRKGQKKIATVVIRIGVKAGKFINRLANERQVSPRVIVDELIAAAQAKKK